MLEVQRSYIEANMEGCGSNNQILESHSYAPRGLLTFNLPCEPCYIQRNWMHNHVPAQLLSEGDALVAIRVRLCSVDAVGQLDHADGGEGAFGFPIGCQDTLDDLLNRLSTTFTTMSTLESRITPMPINRAACGCG